MKSYKLDIRQKSFQQLHSSVRNYIFTKLLTSSSVKFLLSAANANIEMEFKFLPDRQYTVQSPM